MTRCWPTHHAPQRGVSAVGRTSEESGGAASTSGQSVRVRVPLRLRVTGSASGRPDVCIDLLHFSTGAAAAQQHERRSGAAGGLAGGPFPALVAAVALGKAEQTK